MTTTAAPPTTIYDIIEDVARQLYINALTDIPQDVRIGLKRGHENTARERASAVKSRDWPRSRPTPIE